MFGLGFQEMAIILVLGVLLFGSKLPTIGRSLGKTIVEFKRGLHGVEDDVEQVADHSEPSALPAPQPTRPPERLSPAAPKFEDQAQPAHAEEKAELKPESVSTAQV